jgi:hypothetical protein
MPPSILRRRTPSMHRVTRGVCGSTRRTPSDRTCASATHPTPPPRPKVVGYVGAHCDGLPPGAPAHTRRAPIRAMVRAPHRAARRERERKRSGSSYDVDAGFPTWGFRRVDLPRAHSFNVTRRSTLQPPRRPTPRRPQGGDPKRCITLHIAEATLKVHTSTSPVKRHRVPSAPSLMTSTAIIL